MTSAPSLGVSPLHDVSTQLGGMGYLPSMTSAPRGRYPPYHEVNPPPRHLLTCRRVRSDFLGFFGTTTISTPCTTWLVTGDVVISQTFIGGHFDFLEFTLLTLVTFTSLWPMTPRFLELLLAAILNKFKRRGHLDNLAPIILLPCLNSTSAST